MSLANFQALAEKVDFSKYDTVCDVGGATGSCAGSSPRATPHLRCTTFDLPVVAPIAERAIAARKKQLISSAYDALAEGGALVIIENLIDDARRENAFGLMMSLNTLIEFGDA